jgi:succinyl-diaminopimelate desuccinylase
MIESSEREPVTFLQRLLRLESYNPPGRELAVAKAVVEQARAWGLRADLIPLSDDRANLLVSLPEEADGPTVLLLAHLDTVPPGDLPWEHQPLSGDLVDGVLHGRGAVDMKSGLAALLAAMRDLVEVGRSLRGRVRLVGVAGEEVDCAGAKHWLANGGMAGVKWLVVGEPTNLDLVVAHRGALWLELSAEGKTAHGSMPHLGINAIDHLIDLIRGLRGLDLSHQPHTLLAPPTLNVGTIHGGVKTNVVPDRCTATVDLRTLPGQRHEQLIDAVLTLARELEEQTPGLKLEVRVANDMAAVETPVNAPIVQTFQQAAVGVLGRQVAVRGASYYTDASVLQPPTGVPTAVFGPGDDRLAHQPNERVDVKQVVTAIRCYTAFVRDLLA